jgi:phosphohistidine swiveling domain-containing protein
MPKNNQNENLLTLRDAAQRLGMRPITLRKWDREGKLKAVRIGARKDRRYRLDDIEGFLSSSNNAGPKWQEYIRSGITLSVTACVAEALRNGMERYFGRGINYLMKYFEGDTLYWYYDSDDLYDLGKTVVGKLQSDGFRKDFFNSWNESSKKVLDMTKANPYEAVALYDEAKLKKVYFAFSRLLQEFYDTSIAIDATDESLMKDITEQLEKIMKRKMGNIYTKSSFIEAYNLLTQPPSSTYLAKERLLILELAQEVNEDHFKLEDVAFDRQAARIADAYWWTGLSWARGEARSIEDIRKTVKGIIFEKKDLNKEIGSLRSYEKTVREKRLEMVQKYDLKKHPAFMEMLNIFDVLADYHDYRKEVQVKANYWQYRFNDAVSKQYGVPSKLLCWAWPHELEQLLKTGKIDEKELNARSARYLYLNENGKVRSCSGREASRVHEEKLGKTDEETRDLQGIGVSRGKVSGEAFVAITAKSANGILPGQILVTGMTTPDFVLAMRKAAAVVTDEGGITCHAAIISRELGVPCIVGTKFATKTVITGDIIEVAADHNVVRIIEKQKHGNDKAPS